MTVPEADQPLDTREVVRRLQERIDQRHRDGLYPAGLEQELASHLSQSAARLGAREGARAVLLAELDAAAGFDVDRIPNISSVPLGSRFHHAIGLLVRRQVMGVLAQMREYHRALRDLMLEVLDSLPERSSEEVDARVEGTLDQLTRRSRLLNVDLRLAAVQPIYDEAQLIEARRGSRETVLARSEDLARRLAVSQPVADLAAARGEILELLRARGVTAVAAEADATLAEGLRGNGFEVSQSAPLDFLAGQADGALGGIFAGHLLDREGPHAARQLVRLAARKLRPGGLLVIEDDNPAYIARTGEPVRPGNLGRGVGPQELSALLSKDGFAAIEVELRAPAPAQLQQMPDGLADPEFTRILNSNLNLLNELLFPPREYVVIATR